MVIIVEIGDPMDESSPRVCRVDNQLDFRQRSLLNLCQSQGMEE